MAPYSKTTPQSQPPILSLDDIIVTRYYDVMKLRDRELELYLYGGRYPKKYPTGLEKALTRKLQMMKAATTINDLRIPPSNHLEQLKGDLAGCYSIRINSQYRLVFHWDNKEKEATDVYFDDYHK